MASLRCTSAASRRASSSRRVSCRRRSVFTRATSSSRRTGLERKSSAPASMPRTRLSWSSSAVTSTTGISAVAGSRFRRSQMSKPLSPGSMTSSSTRSGRPAPMLAIAAPPSDTVSACMPSFAIILASSAAMSGSSSTTRTRNVACAGARCAASAMSLIRDLQLRQVVAVSCDVRFQRGLVAAARAVLDVLAEQRYLLEAVGIAHAAHAVAELAQLLEIGRGERDAQRIELLLAVAQEHRDEILEVLGHLDFVIFLTHGRHYRG